jgi:hypothetical protein
MKRQLIPLLLLCTALACDNERSEASKEIPSEYIGTWVHDETYINPASDRFTRRRFILQASGDTTVLENWYGIATKTTTQETPLTAPSHLGCRYDSEAKCVLCGSYRWAGPDTLRLHTDGSLHVTGRAYTKTLIFQKKK